MVRRFQVIYYGIVRGFQFVSNIRIDKNNFSAEWKREITILKIHKTFITFSGEDKKTREYNLKRSKYEEKNMAKRVLIMSGGGSKGAFQAGVIEQLRKNGWEPDAVAGISVGALNGVMVATGKSNELVPVWSALREDEILKRRRINQKVSNFLLHKIGIKKPTLGFFDNSPLREKLRKSVGNRFITDFYCGTVNLSTGEYQEHKGLRGMVPWNMLEEVLASTAIPVVLILFC